MERKTITVETNLLKKKGLTIDLLEILSGERDGTKHEITTLNRIMSRLKEKVFIEAVYLLTHMYIDVPGEAHSIFNEIMEHRKHMMASLGRSVSIQVAALDYLQNVRNILKRPIVVEEDTYKEFTYKALFDKTTKTFERSLMDGTIDGEIEKAQRYSVPFSILFIDLDNLKKINDSYGHEIGTKAIQFISRCIRRNLRKYDSIYRYGGDEFVVSLPGTDVHRALIIAQRISEVVHTGRVAGLARKVGISIGVAQYSKKEMKGRKDLLNAADRALYEAKRLGKSKINVSPVTIPMQNTD